MSSYKPGDRVIYYKYTKANYNSPAWKHPATVVRVKKQVTILADMGKTFIVNPDNLKRV